MIWGVGINIVVLFFSKNPPLVNRNAKKLFARGTKTSLAAGILEEIIFRWILFYYAIITAKIVNFLLLGFIGLGLPWLFYTYITRPIANWMTLDYLKHIFFHPAGWAVGAGMLAANTWFRDGHKYQGPFGGINSWFCGMFFFWMLFKYGLLACIIIHFFYDFFIDILVYCDKVIERSYGNYFIKYIRRDSL